MSQPNVVIQRLSTEHAEQLSQLEVEAEQLPFVGTLAEILANVSEWVHPHVIVSGNQVVGFFLIDTQYSQVYTFANEDQLGLRAFFIDRRQQGKGIGKLAIGQLSEYLQHNYPYANQLYLTVNCKNPAAKAVYQKAGFDTLEALFHGGAAGPQHIMVLSLVESNSGSEV